LAFLLSLVLVCVIADDTATRTPWSYIRGPSTFTPDPNPATQHGAASEFELAVLPDPINGPWTPCGPEDSFCISGDDIGIETTSRLPNCWVDLDFSYFLTVVTVPSDFEITEFTIDFTIMDDGAQIYIQNSQYPTLTLVPGSLVTLGGSLNFNFASTDYVVNGINYIVIVQVDDCATQNNIIATVELNGETIVVNTCPEGEGCDDGNSCTQDDTCTTGGICVGTPNVCTPQDQCHFAGTCDPTTGECSTPEKPDNTPCEAGNACTQNDTCKAGTCVSGSYVCCHGAKGCGLCVKDCKIYYETVLNFYQLPNGTECSVIAAGAGTKFCTNNEECCVPQYQTTCFYSNNVCSIPVSILPSQ